MLLVIKSVQRVFFLVLNKIINSFANVNDV